MLKKLDEITLTRPLVKNSSLADYRLPKGSKAELQKQLGDIGYSFDSYTSYAITDKESDDKPANYALIPNQYFAFSSEMHEFATELYKYFEIFEKLRAHAIHLLGNHLQIISCINDNDYMRELFESDLDIELFARFMDNDDSTYRLGSKRLINDQGKARGSRDCFGSVILKEINLPDASSAIFGRLVYDLCRNPEIYKNILTTYNQAKTLACRVQENIIAKSTFLPKPFILLAGISGTGKTRFIRKQAEVTGSLSETYCLTPVRPDWHEPSDLLGYVSRLGEKPEYVCTDVLQFIAKAWRAIAGSNLTIEAQNDRLLVKGENSALDSVKPYWLCLDEMNLAPVEQYFADYLSVLETREWQWQEADFSYSCDALLKSATINEVADKHSLRTALGFEGENYNDIWQLICQYGLPIPFNLMVAGTVNMDETTHGFSRKVIDRALSFDFGAFFPNNYNEFFTPENRNKSLSYPIWSQAKKEDLAETFDPNGDKTIQFLRAVNTALKNTPFELAYRALNELLLSVVCINPQDETTLKAVWDDFMMCKVLPRIEGDADKLEENPEGDNLLQKLEKLLQVELSPIWEADEGDRRPDLYREKDLKADATDADKMIRIDCRSKEKIRWMNKRLETATFTSFWP